MISEAWAPVEFGEGDSSFDAAIWMGPSDAFGATLFMREFHGPLAVVERARRGSALAEPPALRPVLSFHGTISGVSKSSSRDEPGPILLEMTAARSSITHCVRPLKLVANPITYLVGGGSSVSPKLVSS